GDEKGGEERGESTRSGVLEGVGVGHEGEAGIGEEVAGEGTVEHDTKTGVTGEALLSETRGTGRVLGEEVANGVGPSSAGWLEPSDRIPVRREGKAAGAILGSPGQIHEGSSGPESAPVLGGIWQEDEPQSWSRPRAGAGAELGAEAGAGRESGTDVGERKKVLLSETMEAGQPLMAATRTGAVSIATVAAESASTGVESAIKTLVEAGMERLHEGGTSGLPTLNKEEMREGRGRLLTSYSKQRVKGPTTPSGAIYSPLSSPTMTIRDQRRRVSSAAETDKGECFEPKGGEEQVAGVLPQGDAPRGEQSSNPAGAAFLNGVGMQKKGRRIARTPPPFSPLLSCRTEGDCRKGGIRGKGISPGVLRCQLYVAENIKNGGQERGDVSEDGRDSACGKGGMYSSGRSGGPAGQWGRVHPGATGSGSDGGHFPGGRGLLKAHSARWTEVRPPYISKGGKVGVESPALRPWSALPPIPDIEGAGPRRPRPSTCHDRFTAKGQMIQSDRPLRRPASALPRTPCPT
ncbi:unnamed protein product, partial [Discosporangium mesarthrocarpum]